MTTSAIAAHGVTLTRDGNLIAELTAIDGIETKLETIDVTPLSQADSYREYIAGLKDGGEIKIEGNFLYSDTDGQIGLRDDLEAGTLQDFVVTFPTAITATWTFTAYVTSFAAGGFKVGDKVSFSATLKISGKPTLAVTASGGLTGLTGIEENAGGALDFIPNFANGTYIYTVAVNTASTYVKFTPTAASHTIKITNDFDSSISTVVTGNQSGELDLDAANTVTKFTITCYESGKAAKNYYVYVTRAAA